MHKQYPAGARLSISTVRMRRWKRLQKWRPAVLSLSILRVYCTTSAHDSGSSCSVVYVRKHEDAAMVGRNVVSQNCLWTEGDGAL